jgi:hypothetical protein
MGPGRYICGCERRITHANAYSYSYCYCYSHSDSDVHGDSYSDAQTDAYAEV